jgi:predicted transcriptional regulator
MIVITEKQKLFFDVFCKHYQKFGFQQIVAEEMGINPVGILGYIRRLMPKGLIIKNGRKYEPITDIEYQVISMSIAKSPKHKRNLQGDLVEPQTKEPAYSHYFVRGQKVTVISPKHLEPVEYRNGRLFRLPLPVYATTAQ